MNKKELRTCCVCYKKYSFCLCNPDDRLKPTWYFAYCSKNCHDIYDVTSKYENGHISANEAKELLSKLDLSKKDNFGTSYKNAISKIMSEADTVKVDETEPEKKIVKKTSTRRKVKAEDVE